MILATKPTSFLGYLKLWNKWLICCFQLAQSSDRPNYVGSGKDTALVVVAGSCWPSRGRFGRVWTRN